MEYSSPLAAMRPQPYPTWNHRQDLPQLRCGMQTYNAAAFDFKALSMQQRPTRTDYFTLRPVRGSSPTASLTADLDANFHIDKSPLAPTPRRSLFTADLFNPQPNNDPAQLFTPPIDTLMATTPPIPSSSPCFEAMEFSPLPHKLPHFAAHLTLPSPTPEETPSDVDVLSADLLSPLELFPTVPMAPPVQQVPSFSAFPERRRPASRPGLSRTKGLSFAGLPHRATSSETQLPPFRFGNIATNTTTTSSIPTLLDSFVESPIDEVRPLSSASLMPPPPRRPSLSCGSRNNGSPSANHVRKPSGGRPTFVRPQRKLMRRSLSMFQHPDDVVKEEQQQPAFEMPSSLLSTAMEVERENSLKLPHFLPEQENDKLPRITQETMLDVLGSKYNHQYERVLVIDCRFEYEYRGGHIDNAVNFNDMHHLTDHLFGGSVNPSNTLLVLHCEFSVHRAPRAASFIRSHDRNVNSANYPHLSYPELYILDGGYSKFFAQHPSKCFPQNYVEMNDQRHELDCERGMAKVKQQRQRLFRNQTFTFGQSGGDEMDDSPTALGRNQSQRSHSAFNVGLGITDSIGQSFQRRMASY